MQIYDIVALWMKLPKVRSNCCSSSKLDKLMLETAQDEVAWDFDITLIISMLQYIIIYEEKYGRPMAKKIDIAYRAQKLIVTVKDSLKKFNIIVLLFNPLHLRFLLPKDILLT